MATANDADDGDTSNINQLLGVIREAYLFKIPPKTSSMGHMAESWPKKAMWIGRLRIQSTAHECTLQFEDTETEKVYLKVVVNNDPEKPQTIEYAADSQRYFALNIVKPGTDQMFELGLGFQTRDESMDFKMAVGEFERMKQNEEEAKKFNMAVKEDFSLGSDEVLVMKPMANKKKHEQKEADHGGGGGLDGFLPPPSDEKHSKKKKGKKKKKKKKKKADGDAQGDEAKTDNNADGADAFGDFGDFAAADSNADGGWATFD